MKPLITNKLVETKQSKLLDYLPAIYHDQEFLNEYLSAFEKILIGKADTPRSTDITVQPGGSPLKQRMQEGAESRSLEKTIDLIPVLFDPLNTPKDFLPWLAGWAALSLRADLQEDAQRQFVAKIIQLYRRRGTKENLIELLKIFTQVPPEIDENASPSKTFTDRFSQFKPDEAPKTNPPPPPPPPLHFFKVSILLTDPNPETLQHKRDIAHALIEMEKPAHTFYELVTTFTSMRIGTYEDKTRYRATLGVDTLINDWNQANRDQLEKEAKEKKNAGT